MTDLKNSKSIGSKITAGLGIGGVSSVLLWNVYASLDNRIRENEKYIAKGKVIEVITKDDINEIKTDIKTILQKINSR